MANNKLQLSEVLAAIDTDSKEIWDELSDDEKKGLTGDLYILNRYISSVRGSRTEQEYAVLLANEFYNKHWFTLSKHPELLWKLACMCSQDDKKIRRHEWIGFKKKSAGNDKVVNFLAKCYPNYKMDDILLMAKITPLAEIKELAKSLGYDSAQVKKML